MKEIFNCYYEVIYDDVTVSANGEVCAVRSAVVGLRRIEESADE